MSPKLAGAREPTLLGLVHQAIADARAFATAELALVKALALARVAAIKPGIIMIVIGVVVANAAIIALLVGFVIALVPLIGAWGAAFAVGLGALIVGGGLAYLGVSKLATKLEVG